MEKLWLYLAMLCVIGAFLCLKKDWYKRYLTVLLLVFLLYIVDRGMYMDYNKRFSGIKHYDTAEADSIQLDSGDGHIYGRLGAIRETDGYYTAFVYVENERNPMKIGLAIPKDNFKLHEEWLASYELVFLKNTPLTGSGEQIEIDGETYCLADTVTAMKPIAQGEGEIVGFFSRILEVGIVFWTAFIIWGIPALIRSISAKKKRAEEDLSVYVPVRLRIRKAVKKPLTWVGLLCLLAALFFRLYPDRIRPRIQYRKAESLMQEGNYLEARREFCDLLDYKDSWEKASACTKQIKTENSGGR